MIEILNSMAPFMEDNYLRINVREYARILKISPPTASKKLQSYFKEGLLKKEVDRQYYYYYANRESKIFIDLQRAHWRIKIENSSFIKDIEQIFLNPVIMLFGSLSKVEAKEDSDIDIAIFSVTKREFDVSTYEKKLNKKIQLFIFKDIYSVTNKQLLNNILNGYKVTGLW
jgi:predicted nucleotidyltransferase